MSKVIRRGGLVALAAVMVTPTLLLTAQAAQAATDTAPRWRAQTPPIPVGSLWTEPVAVSCVTRTACVMVGEYQDSKGTYEAFAEVWRGRSWAIRSVPHALSSHLNSLSCTSTTTCIAVGDLVSGTAQIPLAVRWNGSRWTMQSTPLPPGVVTASISSVSCSSSRACMAVGSSATAGGSHRTLAERWNGSSWRLQHAPGVAGQTTNALNAVSCRTATACTVMGTSDAGMFADTWNGRSWKLRRVPVPSTAQEPFLSSISCPAARSCTAVGDYVANSNDAPLVARWNGSRWETKSAALPTGAGQGGLESVSCPRSNACFAVGFAEKGSKGLPLAERWNGSRWVLQSIKFPAGATNAALGNVSCSASTVCSAVGYRDSVTTSHILAERYS